MKNNELNDNVLDQVFGGVLTPEAEQWVTDHREEVIERAGILGGLADVGLAYVRKDKQEYDVAGLKAAIKGFGINVDDIG